MDKVKILKSIGVGIGVFVLILAGIGGLAILISKAGEIIMGVAMSIFLIAWFSYQAYRYFE